ncbi:hypothetical protein HK103_004457 [Boothiomyces macroporosus]|uniref:Uncharacterized protein n=1 Tax=Boothiomyces macroporosus TaxID=261099 RepID=A0AAD5Y5T6_9FUNG|nr:hypothetical protein HK103_004457 [Boothiomyces macroporosus]
MTANSKQKVGLALLSCTESNLSYYNKYLDAYEPYISKNDFDHIQKELNIVLQFGPKKYIMNLLLGCIIGCFTLFVVIGFLVAKTGSNIVFAFIPLILAIACGIWLASYRTNSFKSLETNLLKASTSLSEAFESKNILVEYSKDSRGIMNTADDKYVKVARRYEYNVFIYYLQDSADQVVLDIGDFAAQTRARKYEQAPFSNYFASWV